MRTDINFIKCAKCGGKVIEKRLKDETYIKLCIDDEGNVFKTDPYTKHKKVDDIVATKVEEPIVQKATEADILRLIQHFNNK